MERQAGRRLLESAIVRLGRSLATATLAGRPGHAWHWVGEGADFNYLDVFDSLYYFDISWAARPADAMGGYARRLSDYNRTHNTNKPFISTVMPGYDDSRIRSGHEVRSRANGDYYRAAWQDALDRNAQAVIVYSWNEWFEGTQIEPSQSYGNLYLDLTREWSARYQSGGRPPTCAGYWRDAPSPKPDRPCVGDCCSTGKATVLCRCSACRFGPEAQQQTPDGPSARRFSSAIAWSFIPENAAPYDVLLGRLGRTC